MVFYNILFKSFIWRNLCKCEFHWLFQYQTWQLRGENTQHCGRRNVLLEAATLMHSPENWSKSKEITKPNKQGNFFFPTKAQLTSILWEPSLHKKILPLRTYLINLNKSAVSCRFIQIYDKIYNGKLNFLCSVFLKITVLEVLGLY